MRKILIKSLAGAVLLTVAGATGATAQNINGSKHDLEVGTEGICTYCHTPHYAENVQVPLWARDTATTTWTMYSSATLDATSPTAPENSSLACLSCHDGATAYNSLAGTNTVVGGDASTMTGAAVVGASGNLADDHPISIEYAAAGETGLNAAVSGYVDVLPLFHATGTTTGSGTQVECATCHNVHDNNVAAPFLRKANTASGLCLTCHNK